MHSSLCLKITLWSIFWYPNFRGEKTKNQVKLTHSERWSLMKMRFKSLSFRKQSPCLTMRLVPLAFLAAFYLKLLFLNSSTFSSGNVDVTQAPFLGSTPSLDSSLKVLNSLAMDHSLCWLPYVKDFPQFIDPSSLSFSDSSVKQPPVWHMEKELPRTIEGERAL